MKKRDIMPTTWLLVAILLAAGLHLVAPIARVVPKPWHLLGLLPLADGVYLNLVADGAFRRADTTVKPFQPSTALLSDGAFRLTRNPMYLGFVLILAGEALLLRSVTPWVAVVALGVLLDRAYIAVEERMLGETFGDMWQAYRRRTRRWV